MKIAVATMDGVSLSQHFGQSAGFVVFELDEKTVKNRELRMNQRTPHAEALCNHSAQESEHRGHGHGILGILGDCDIVLCGGMGAGAAQALNANGIQPVVIAGPCSADEAIAQYVAGKSELSQPGFCSCNH